MSRGLDLSVKSKPEPPLSAAPSRGATRSAQSAFRRRVPPSPSPLARPRAECARHLDHGLATAPRLPTFSFRQPPFAFATNGVDDVPNRVAIEHYPLPCLAFRPAKWGWSAARRLLQSCSDPRARPCRIVRTPRPQPKPRKFFAGWCREIVVSEAEASSSHNADVTRCGHRARGQLRFRVCQQARHESPLSRPPEGVCSTTNPLLPRPEERRRHLAVALLVMFSAGEASTIRHVGQDGGVENSTWSSLRAVY